jgi:hypothetical protein
MARSRHRVFPGEWKFFETRTVFPTFARNPCRTFFSLKVTLLRKTAFGKWI